MTDPAMFYRDAPINRFIDLCRDPQDAIFWNFSINSRLEAKDNFIPLLDEPVPDDGFPNGSDTWKPCSIKINNGPSCGNDKNYAMCNTM